MEHYLYFILQIFLAVILGGTVGWQREHIGKAAGPRTYALVCVGSALFTILSMQAFGEGETSRMAAQIITGIGFIGAGMILHKRNAVEGLTTAAGLWVIAAIGTAIGAGWLWEAIIVSGVIFTILAINDKTLFH
ncbi:MAG: MgtC/SapB family protein [Candidatus Magasanikbacteria bacterium]|nr:MgtC/SapB family protein [Candidatus Magasanikbacteria bacterium]